MGRAQIENARIGKHPVSEAAPTTRAPDTQHIPRSQGRTDDPGLVYGIVISLFVLFNCFAIVQWKQYRATGTWADYLCGERRYIVLSLVAKSLLAWQVFAGTLAARRTHERA